MWFVNYASSKGVGSKKQDSGKREKHKYKKKLHDPRCRDQHALREDQRKGGEAVWERQARLTGVAKALP